MTNEPIVINRVELDIDHEGNLYIARAWAGDEIVIDANSDARPHLVVEGGRVTDILYGDLETSVFELPEFAPFPAVEGIHELGN